MIIAVNRYYAPDESATSQLLTQLCTRAAAAGLDVVVLCARGWHGEQTASLAREATIDGVRVTRLRATHLGRIHLLGRLLDYGSFYAHVAWRLLWLSRPGVTILAKTDPPMLAVVCAAVARARGARLVTWVQDVFPEVADRLGLPLTGGRVGRVLRWLRNRAMRRAAVNVAIGERMAAYLRTQGVPPDRLEVIHNWAQPDIRPVARDQNSLRRCWGLAEAFVVGYSGNMGRAHEFETILSAASRLQGERIRFLFIGDGFHRSALEEEAARRQLDNVTFRPYQQRECLAESLSTPDLHLVTLLPELEGLIVPSKLYGILAAGRPVFFVGSLEGEVARILNDGGCGKSFAIGDDDGLTRSILEASRQPHLCASWSAAARRLADGEFSHDRSLGQWMTLLRRLEKGGVPSTKARRE